MVTQRSLRLRCARCVTDLNMGNSQKKILVTGSAGFIGMHTAIALAKGGYKVLGLDNLNTYYSVDLKLARLKEQGIRTQMIQYNTLIEGDKNIDFIQLDLADENKIEALFAEHKFDYVIHLAAQAGVRYSIENPHAYVDSNVKGFLNILEASAKNKVKHLVFASSSSIYGCNKDVPFCEDHQTDQQVSLYAATKKANEAMAHSYASVHKLPVTGLRFFTVYGPYGRPDMALFKFTERILNNKSIDVYNNGDLRRDFTYIDDIINGITALVEQKPENELGYEVYNIGNGSPVQLMDFIREIEKATGQEAQLNMLPMQPGDVYETYASTRKLNEKVDYQPRIGIREGVQQFVDWYSQYFNIETSKRHERV